jgi:phosphomannomutase/phosphoglucomutase
MPTTTVPTHIFREYDIRGLHATELSDPTAEAVGRAFATRIRAEGGTRVALGQDVRPSSERLARAAERGMIAAGLAVERVGVVPTPALYFAVAQRGLDGGMQITGSHNPPEFNGFKMTKTEAAALRPGDPRDAPRHPGRRARLRRRRLVERQADHGRVPGHAHRTLLEPEGPERGHGLRKRLRRHRGAAGVRKDGPHRDPALRRAGRRFPNHLPIPPCRRCSWTCSEGEGDRRRFGFGFDGDADRIGAVTATGRIVWGDQLLALFARDVLSRVPGATVVFDVKCSQALSEDIAAHGGKPLMWKTGHSLLKKKLAETGAPLAGEMSGHMFFSEGYFGYDDALFAAGRLLRYVASTGKTLEQLVASLPQYFSTPEMRLACPEERKFQVPDLLKSEFAAKYRVIDIDGIRVEFGDGWGLVRASNTQPVLVVRFEARTEKRLAEIRDMMMGALKRVGVEDAPVAH